MEDTKEEPWPLVPTDYTLTHPIGYGAFGAVYKGWCEKKGMFVAIKVLDLEHLVAGLDDIRHYQTEVATMMLCRHPNVLECLAAFPHGDKLWLITPFMDRGSCFHILNVLKSRPGAAEAEGFQEDWIAAILKETLNGLAYFHDQGKIHRDVKAGNILVDSAGHVKLADFGVSAWLQDAGSVRRTATTFVGTPCWMAPEVMEQLSGYDSKADIWSVGITALELAKGFAPYAKLQPMKVLMRTLQDEPPSLSCYPDGGSSKLSKHFREIVQCCLVKDPLKRPTCRQLLKKRFFESAPSMEVVVKELLSTIPPLEDVVRVERPIGTMPIGLQADGAGVKVSAVGKKAGADEEIGYVAGTTWVFDEPAATTRPTEDVSDDALAAEFNTGEF